MTLPRPLPPRRHLRARAALPLAGLLLTACSSGGTGATDGAGAGDQDGQQVVRAVPASLRQEGSARFDLRAEVRTGGEPVVLTGEGAFDVVEEVSRVVLTLPFGEVEQRTVGGTVYVAVPGLTGEGQFLSLAAEQLRRSPLGGTDPVALAGALETATEVERTGEEEVTGVATTVYEGVVDVDALLQGGPDAGAAVPSAEPPVQELPFTAWVDDEGRLRRLEQQLVVPGGGATGPVEALATVELSDFGTAVDVQAPPADAVQDGGPVLERLLGGARG